MIFSTSFMPNIRVRVLMALILFGVVAMAAQAEDFAQTCAMSGVVKCVGFDSSSDINGKLVQGNGALPQIDTSTKASGTGSLKMTYAPGGANSTGAWGDTIGAVFGESSKLYLAYKQRFSSSLLGGGGGGNGWKQHILYGDKSCGPMEITTQNTYHRGFPQMYSQCGSYQFYEVLPGSDYRLQKGEGLDCRYKSMSGCAKYIADKWVTFYYEIEIGRWGSSNSKLRAYMQVDGEWQQWMDLESIVLQSDGAAGFQNILLTMYTTGGTGGSTASTWYDDFVVSRQPIYDVADGGNEIKTPAAPPGLIIR